MNTSTSFFTEMLQLSVMFVAVGGAMAIFSDDFIPVISARLPWLIPDTILPDMVRIASDVGEVAVILGVITGIVWMGGLALIYIASVKVGGTPSERREETRE